MEERSEDLQKLVAVATDLGLPEKVRTDAIKFIANISTHDALLALLDLVANERLTRAERELALNQARRIVRAGH